MAIKWAVANGNWNASATWNDGILPTSEDVVYANNFTITVNVSVSVLELRNDAPEDMPEISAGGIFDLYRGVNVIADCYAKNGYLLNIHANSYTEIVINGNCYCDGGNLFSIAQNSDGFTINGDIETTNDDIIKFTTTHGGQYLTINGNINIHGTGRIIVGNATYYNGSTTLIINGNINDSVGSTTPLLGSTSKKVVLNGTSIIKSPLLSVQNEFDIIGSLTLPVDKNMSNGNITAINLTGELNCGYPTLAQYPIGQTNVAEGSRITYTSKCPMCWGELNAPSDFNFECVGTETGTHRIINKTLLNDTYPQEGEVEHGVIYGYAGEKEGAFDQPQENVVMAGYQYDFGQKTGTLAIEIPQEVTEQLEDIDANMLAVKNAVSNSERLIAETKGGVANLPSEQFIAELLGD